MLYRTLFSLVFVTLVGAGGRPLGHCVLVKSHPDNCSDRQPEHEPVGQKNVDDLRRLLEKLYPENDAPLDLEYAAILADIDMQNSLYKLTHRDAQWQEVAHLMQSMDDMEDRAELIKNVRRYPLHRKLPATVPISPRALDFWQQARTGFLKRIRPR